MAALDTTVFVDLRGKDPRLEERALAKLAELRSKGESIVTTYFTLAELYVGINRARNPVEEERIIQSLMGDMSVLAFGERSARLFGWIIAILQREGRPCGEMDALIAATAISEGHCIVTRNAEHFSRIPDLVVETY